MFNSDNKQNIVFTLSVFSKTLGDIQSQSLYDIVVNILSNKNYNIILDLKKVELINSIGIGIILSCLTAVKNQNGQLKLAGLSKKVYQILKLTEIDTLLEVYNNLEEAIESFKT